MSFVIDRASRRPRHRLGPGARLLTALGYLAALTVLGHWAHHGWPPSNGAGLWFYSAAVAVLFSVFLNEPFFTTPKAALGTSGALFLFALTADRQGLQASKHIVEDGRIVLLALSGGVFIIAAIAVASRDRWPRINAAAFPIAVTLGSGAFLFGVAFVFSVYATFAHDSTRLVILLGAALLFTWDPLERLVVSFSGVRRGAASTAVFIRSIQDPATAIVEAPVRALAVGDRLREPNGTVGVVVDTTATSTYQSARVAFQEGVVLRIGSRLTVPQGAPADGDAVVVGYVAPGSAMNAIRVGAPSSVSKFEVEEGRLLAATVRGNEVLFQVVGASVQEETLGSEVHERFRIDAQKLGRWDPATNSFDLVPWLPDPGTAVTLKTREEANFESEGIGFVPGSRFAIRYKPRSAVTHNTAILGILGSGKTTLARELICRNMCDGVKVLALDVTGQYAPFYDSLIPAAEATERIASINGACAAFHGSRARDADNFFGSRGEFARQLRADIADFLNGDDPIRIYDPFRFNVTTIDGFPRGGQAESLRELSLVEKVSLIAFALLQETQARGETEAGRVCLVIEEAHSLTPEPNDGLNKEDTRAVILTARSVLQGRKFGYGCLLITQRTANVTKTILNQCHTVFALRSYDATGMAFLSNYLGDQYSRLLSSMPKYHCVAFGEGISCTAPVVMRLNDPTVFRASYWNGKVDDLRPPRLDVGEAAAIAVEGDGAGPAPA
jgi:hypothetical protein